MANVLWTIIVILFVLWLTGFAVLFGGSLIHLLLLSRSSRSSGT